jgi:PAS domain S-box-containing protein
MQRHIAQSAVARYGVAVASVILAVVPALWLRPLALAGAQFLLVAVLITGWVGGLRPALVAWGLAILVFKYYFTPPLDSLTVDLAELPRLIVFAVIALLMATVSAARRKAEDALKSARDGLEERVRERTVRFRDLVNSVEGIVWEADATTFRFLFVSDQAERILGYPVERWLSEPTFWKDHLHPDDRERAVSFCERATGEHRDHDVEYRMIAADGRVVWLHDLVTVVVDGGRATQLRGVMVDITDRKHAETALHERAGLLDLTHDTVFVRDMADVLTYWNRAAEEFYGWTATEAVGKVSHQLMQTIFPAPIEHIQATLLQAGRWEGELVHTKADGSQAVVASRWSLQRDQQGQPLAILETNNDITTRKQAEYLTGHVFDTSPDAIYIVGRDYRYRRVNPVFARRWRLPAEEIVGMLMADLAGKEPFEETYRANLDRCFAGEEVSFGGWFPTPGGRRYLVATYSPLRPDSERVEAALAVTRDLTDRIRESEALQEAQAELAHVTRVTTLGELTASIAHEVNQPLAAIVADATASLNWLAASPPDLDHVREALDAIVKDGHRAAEVIRRIRQLATKTSPQKARLDVNDVIRDVVPLIGTQMRSHEVSLRIDLAPVLPPVLADRVQLQQVLINFVMNGIEAMASVDGRARELVIRSQPEDDDHVVVAVQDAGVGIDPQKTDQLFVAFYTTKPDGMGMGLSISRSIIEAHGGRLWATPNPDHGATFHFALPKMEDRRTA